MIKFENIITPSPEQWISIILGARNAMNSWDRSDSKIEYENVRDSTGRIFIGTNDLTLLRNLRNAGTDHRKFMRMITVYVDITAPLYWWKEFDTYKVGTVANSCSTMHKIADKEFELSDFSFNNLFGTNIEVLEFVIKQLNYNRHEYLKLGEEIKNTVSGGQKVRFKDKQKKYWWQMIQLLPSSYNQKRTVMMNYEVLANIYKSRKNHKLDEWSVGFIEWIESLPYSELITGKFEENKNE